MYKILQPNLRGFSRKPILVKFNNNIQLIDFQLQKTIWVFYLPKKLFYISFVECLYLCRVVEKQSLRVEFSVEHL